MLSHDGKPTGLGDAFAHYGRIFKTLHLLQLLSDEGCRRLIGARLNVTGASRRLARKIFFGQRGELRRHHREGMEDHLGTLGLALDAVVLFNSLCSDAAVEQLAADGFPVIDEPLARRPAPVRPYRLPRPLRLHATAGVGPAPAVRPAQQRRHGRRRGPITAGPYSRRRSGRSPLVDRDRPTPGRRVIEETRCRGRRAERAWRACSGVVAQRTGGAGNRDLPARFDGTAPGR
ncbi:hypothetical protein GCM10010121_037470 [Streptomyces brasiliensis]|uniref:Tn3 transposase DDE domain-containing protein n=2 Tax=Streptomyces brasiliensis TaxID=1954 RepID=A0A917KQG5_9ACTN|nr:hypothetical protein GCM10010121_037470 [Streptomyces brasiliensis]